MKRSILSAAIAAMCLLSACEEPRTAAPANVTEVCEPGDRDCTYDDGTAK